MSQRVNATAIGWFVIGAVTILIAGILVFSSGQLFQQRDRYMLFFEGSVKGLDVGASVLFRGVRVGQVADIQIQMPEEGIDLLIPVIIDLFPETVSDPYDQMADAPDDDMQDFIDRGLRAKMVTDSLVTGKLVIELEYQPGEEGRFEPGDHPYPQLPTIPSTFERLGENFKSLMSRLDSLPLDQVVNDLAATLQNFRNLTDNPALPQAIDDFAATMGHMRSVAAGLDSRKGQLADQIDRNLQHMDELILSLKDMAEDGDKLAVSGQDTLVRFQQTLDQMDQTLVAYENLVNHNSEVRVSTVQTMNELSAAARSLRTLTDMLQRQPQSVVFGKQ